MGGKESRVVLSRYFLLHVKDFKSWKWNTIVMFKIFTTVLRGSEWATLRIPCFAKTLQSKTAQHNNDYVQNKILKKRKNFTHSYVGAEPPWLSTVGRGADTQPPPLGKPRTRRMPPPFPHPGDHLRYLKALGNSPYSMQSSNLWGQRYSRGWDPNLKGMQFQYHVPQSQPRYEKRFTT